MPRLRMALAGWSRLKPGAVPAVSRAALSAAIGNYQNMRSQSLAAGGVLCASIVLRVPPRPRLPPFFRPAASRADFSGGPRAGRLGRELDPIGRAVVPDEADPPPIVNPDAVLPGTVAFRRFEAIAGGRARRASTSRLRVAEIRHDRG